MGHQFIAGDSWATHENLRSSILNANQRLFLMKLSSFIPAIQIIGARGNECNELWDKMCAKDATSKAVADCFLFRARSIPKRVPHEVSEQAWICLFQAHLALATYSHHDVSVDGYLC